MEVEAAKSQWLSAMKKKKSKQGLTRGEEQGREMKKRRVGKGSRVGGRLSDKGQGVCGDSDGERGGEEEEGERG